MLDAWCDFLWRHPKRVLVLGALVTAAAAALGSRLELRTNFAELLPSRDPAVIDLERTAHRLGGTAILQIAVESPDRQANLRFAAALTAELRRLPPEVLDSVAYDVIAEQKFFRDRRWLYAPLEELTALRDSLRHELASRKNPFYVELDDSDSPRALARRLRARGAQQLERFPTGFFEGEDGRLVAMVCRPPGGLFAERAGERLVVETRRLITATRPESFHPAMRVRLTGDVMAQLEERQALESDLLWATGVCVTLVCLVVLLFYGRFRALPQVGLPALVGVAVAFGVAELAFGYLNASTAFLGSIVVGNGINFPIIVLARYEEEREAGRAPREAARIALAATARPTGIAALGAAIAYGSLLTTRFRGFSQFGAIGGAGMLAAWLATVTLLPALWAATDRRSRVRRLAASRASFGGWVARLSAGAPRLCLAGFGLLTVLSALPLARYLHDPFEYDFRNLRNRRSIESGAESIAPRVDRIFGLTLTPSVIVADRRDQVAELARVVLARDRARSATSGSLLGAVTTLDSFLPGDAALQKNKLAVLGELRALLDSPALELGIASDEERAELRAERPPDDLRAVTERDLPAQVRRPFTETDGTLGRVVLVYHGAQVSVWDGRNLLGIAALIAEVPLSDGSVVRSSGHAVIFSSMIRSIAHDAPRATLVSLLGVALLVLLLQRDRGAPLVLGALFAGVLWMLGAAAWLGVRTNFLNFIALPITFGIGVDYGINILRRCQLERSVAAAVRASGGAVALCSLTTIIGYAALLVADNLALRSFGAMAILGETACLSAAVIGLPAYLVWRARD